MNVTDNHQDLDKLNALRDAWVKFTCPAVASVATVVLQKACADLTIPEKALDLIAFKDVVELCKPKKQVQAPTALNGCPLVTIQPISTPQKSPLKPSQLAKVVLDPKDMRAMLPKKMLNSKEVIDKLQGLARFLLHHGISDDLIEFVVRVHMLVPPGCKINWSLWLCSPINAGRPPLWWRVIMLILASAAPYYIQMTSVSRSGSGGFSSHYVDIMNKAEYQGQVPNLDIWTWDTAAVLKILQTNLFAQNTNQAAKRALQDYRNEVGHFNVSMSFGEGFDCICKLLESLGRNVAVLKLKEFRKSVSTWFPAFSEERKMEQSRSRALLLTTRQFDAFRKHVLDPSGSIKKRIRVRYQCAASSGKTVIATILAVEFALECMSADGDIANETDQCVLFLTHAQILARRTAIEVRDQIKVKLVKLVQPEKVVRMLKTVQVKRMGGGDGCDVHKILVGKNEVVVVATINAALKSLRGRVFRGGVVVDEAHCVYGSDRRAGQNIGQNILPAKEIAPIIEAWGGARDENEGANRLVLFGDERNQSMRRRFNDTGEDLARCDGCGTKR